MTSTSIWNYEFSRKIAKMVIYWVNIIDNWNSDSVGIKNKIERWLKIYRELILRTNQSNATMAALTSAAIKSSPQESVTPALYVTATWLVPQSALITNCHENTPRVQKHPFKPEGPLKFLVLNWKYCAEL